MIAPNAEPIEFTVTSSLADAIVAEKTAEPGRLKRSGLSRRVLLFAAIFLTTLAVVGVYDNPGDPTAFLRTLMSAKMGLYALANIAVIVIVLAGMMFGVRAMNQAFRRKLCADRRRDHPAVDPRDPTLGLARTYRFDETGMTTASAYDEVWESWSRIQALDETPDLLIVRAGGLLNFPLPKAQMSPALRERLQHYVDSRSHSKWPF